MISVIVPIYNGAQYLARCIESVLNQTYKEYELLLIDDGSTDNSRDIILSYQKQYPEKIKVISKENEGVVATRHLGIKKSIGEYVAFLDNDDYFNSEYLETFMKVTKGGEYDIVLGGYKRVDLDRTIFSVEASSKEWTKYQITAPWARIFKKSFIVDNDIHFLEYEIGEDVYFNMLAYKNTSKIKVINYSGYNWFYNQKSVSNTMQKGLNNEVDILFLMDKIYDIYQNNMEELLHYFFTRYIVWYLLFSGRNGKSADFVTEQERLFKWLKEHKIENKIHLFSAKIRGEPLKNRIAVTALICIDRFKVVKLFSKIYCKGK